ncbi:MAG: 50S ribosomal protein L11 methyltransferase [Nitrososphaerota archaeon]|nr:50S ribosomal protein L11 methyltransferase [Nitrososphaerota archaeon]
MIETILRPLHGLYWSTRLAERNKTGESYLGNLYIKLHRWKEPIILKDGRFSLNLDKKHAGLMLIERMHWPKWYGSDFKDKIVLDVGAGNGETASFFFNRGAKMVIAVECDEKALSYLRHNRHLNNWNMAIIPAKFRNDHLLLPHDVLKMDIEGGESVLMDWNRPLGDARIELHPQFIGEQMAHDLVQKFHLKQVQAPYVWRSDKC